MDICCEISGPCALPFAFAPAIGAGFEVEYGMNIMFPAFIWSFWFMQFACASISGSRLNFSAIDHQCIAVYGCVVHIKTSPSAEVSYIDTLKDMQMSGRT